MNIQRPFLFVTNRGILIKHIKTEIYLLKNKMTMLYFRSSLGTGGFALAKQTFTATVITENLS